MDCRRMVIAVDPPAAIALIDLVDSDAESSQPVSDSSSKKSVELKSSDAFTLSSSSSSSDTVGTVDLKSPPSRFEKKYEEDKELMASLLRAKAIFRNKVRMEVSNTPSILRYENRSSEMNDVEATSPKIDWETRKRHMKLLDELDDILDDIRVTKRVEKAQKRSSISRPLISISGRPLRRKLVEDFAAFPDSDESSSESS